MTKHSIFQRYKQEITEYGRPVAPSELQAGMQSLVLDAHNNTAFMAAIHQMDWDS